MPNSSVPSRRRWRWRVGLVLAGALGASVITASSAPATTTPPAPTAAPTITGGPTGTTGATTATFTYSHPQPGVTFLCSLDGASFRSCSTRGVTYNGLRDGAHTFSVAARSGASALGPVATRTWTIDRTAPTVAVTGPADDSVLDSAGWAAACTTPGVCGTAADANGVTDVTVAVLQISSGRYWNGTAFAAGSPQFQAATGTTAWSLPLPLPRDGTYQVRVRARDAVGNVSSSSALRATFTVDTQPALVPVITAGPDDVETATGATFRFELPSRSFGSGDDDDDDDDDDREDDRDRGTAFECSLDGGAFRSCSSPRRYRSLGLGEHCFEVRSRNAAGRPSDPARQCWWIVIDNGFPITGDVADAFTPGVSRPVDLRLGNPFPFPLRVLEVTMSVRPSTSNAGCAGDVNLVPSRQLATAVVVPAGATRTLSELGVPEASWPVLVMPNLPVNQDACKNATFSLAYRGRATKA